MAYDFWGEDCVNKFNGMWAFAILNENNNDLFCSRDRFGVKPFNYSLSDERFIFSSEIKSIIKYDHSLKKPNYNSIGLFCREGVCGEIPETWFDNIFRLPPAHNLTIKKNEINIYKYYNLPYKTKDIPFKEAKEKFYKLFINSVKLRMRSDVPVGTTLSGGLDSSSIVAALRTFSDIKHDTFTAHSPGYISTELEAADKTNELLKLEGNPVIIDYNDDYLETLQKIIYHLESGHLSPAIFPLWKVYEKAKVKVTVVLEGQGADELLGGYITSIGGYYLEDKLRKLQFKKFYSNLRLLARNYSLKNITIMYLRQRLPSTIRTFIRRYGLKSENILIGKLKYSHNDNKYDEISNSSTIKKLKYAHQTTLVNLLHYGDAISMAFSLESRLPFMDYNLVNFAFSLPEDFMINGKGKYILRESLMSILPNHINNDIKKLGFHSPIKEFFEINRSSLQEIFLAETTVNRGLFDEYKLNKLLNAKSTIDDKKSRFLFRLLCVEMWFRIFIDENKPKETIITNKPGIH